MSSHSVLDAGGNIIIDVFTILVLLYALGLSIINLYWIIRAYGNVKRWPREARIASGTLPSFYIVLLVGDGSRIGGVGRVIITFLWALTAHGIARSIRGAGRGRTSS